MGKEQAINLGVDYDRCVRRLLLGVTLAIAVATAMVGPISFMGLIIANLSRQLLKTYRHTQLIAGSVLFGMVILVGGPADCGACVHLFHPHQRVHHRGRRGVFPLSAAHKKEGLTVAHPRAYQTIRRQNCGGFRHLCNTQRQGVVPSSAPTGRANPPSWALSPGSSPGTAGLVDFEGRDIAKWKSKELSKRLAILTQSNSIQMKLTVRELVTFGRFPYSGRRTTPEDQRIIDQAIAYMELEEFQDRFIDELSGGQRQRALIAMVIAQDTEYVLLDEPTNNLDIYHATNMMRTVRKLCDELGKTVILVLHEINYAAFYSDYICAFVDGKVAKFGTVEEVMTKGNLSAIYQVDFEILEIEGKPLSIYY